ncbi:MAG TPA: L,D-transpeptidase family protein [Chloroflexota bacterium]|nr:L,D-transpeptidase family protein [Chloroflexota bacterium]
MHSRVQLVLVVLLFALGLALPPRVLHAAEASAAPLGQATSSRPPPTATPPGSGAALPPPFATPASATPTRGAIPSPTTAPTAPPVTPTAVPVATSTPAADPTAVSPHGNGQWVTNAAPLELWSSPDADAVSLGSAHAGSYFELTGAGTDQRLFVYSPQIVEYAWVDATAVAPSAPPSSGTRASPERIATVNLPGRSLAYTVRSEPRVAPETRVRDLPHNTPVFVYDAVRGADGEVWYRIGDGEYVHSDGIRLPKGPPLMYSGRWIDVDLQEPTLITAYEDDRIVYTALALHGTIADSTPAGVYRIQRRVENETMSSETLGIPRDAPGGYYVENVLYTQYFTNDGAAIHYNYWSNHFGYAGTHGCLGVNYDDALWFWNWASLGTTVNIH